MIRSVSMLLVLWLPLTALAQAYRCPDPASGRILYTDQPCAGGATVVPKPTPEQLQEQAQRDDAARERARLERELAVEREARRQEEARAAEALRPPPPPPSESQACRAAREEASFRAASVTATEEQIRTARANAALACGQPAPPEIVVVPPRPRWQGPRHPFHERPVRPPRPIPDRQPQYAPGTEPLPMR